MGCKSKSLRGEECELGELARVDASATGDETIIELEFWRMLSATKARRTFIILIDCRRERTRSRSKE